MRDEATLENVTLNWDTGEDFLSSYVEDGGAFIRLHEQLGLEEEQLVLARLVFRDRDVFFQVHGIFRSEGDKGERLELLPEEEERHRMVQVCARGESLPYRRRRSPRVTWRADAMLIDSKGDEHPCRTTTIGAGGAHLTLDRRFEIDDEVSVRLNLLDPSSGQRSPMLLRARVTAVIERGPSRGCSLEFLFSSSDERDAVARRVAPLLSPP